MAVQDRFVVIGQGTVPVDDGSHLLGFGTAFEDGRAQGLLQYEFPGQGLMGSQRQFFERMGERIVTEIMAECRNEKGSQAFRCREGNLSTLDKGYGQAPREIIDTDAVGFPCMCRAGIDMGDGSQLSHPIQHLKRRGAGEHEERFVEMDIAPDWIANDSVKSLRYRKQKTDI